MEKFNYTRIKLDFSSVVAVRCVCVWELAELEGERDQMDWEWLKLMMPSVYTPIFGNDKIFVEFTLDVGFFNLCRNSSMHRMPKHTIDWTEYSRRRRYSLFSLERAYLKICEIIIASLLSQNQSKCVWMSNICLWIWAYFVNDIQFEALIFICVLNLRIWCGNVSFPTKLRWLHLSAPHNPNNVGRCVCVCLFVYIYAYTTLWNCTWYTFKVCTGAYYS